MRSALDEALRDAIDQLPIPKVMSYARDGGYYNDVKFVRPAHRLIALHGGDIVRASALGLDAGRTTEGHRFLGRREIALSLQDFAALLGVTVGRLDIRSAETRMARRMSSSGARRSFCNG